jgi:aspartyl-tRNA(Asn)/glutamyl-tRNA(Gln) amidotransferase subunit B
MRCDANISIRKVGSKVLGTKVEIKNMNSFKMVKKAIEYEAKRQEEVLSEGGKLTQETRGWDDSKGKTISQRSKEFANDYRYFPEPDIPPITTGTSTDFDPKVIKKRLGELPQEKRERFEKIYGLSKSDAHNLSIDLARAVFFERAVKYADEFVKDSAKLGEIAKLASNFMTDTSFKEQDITSEYFAGLISLVVREDISLTIAKEILPEMIKGKKTAKDVIEQKGYSQISNVSELNKIITQVLSENVKITEDYRAGKTQLFGYFVGQVMAKTKGQANPKLVNDLLKKKLEE